MKTLGSSIIATAAKARRVDERRRHDVGLRCCHLLRLLPVFHTCLYRKLDSAIMVMKSAEDRHRCDAAYVLDGAMDRSVFAKRPMSPQLVIISGILRQDSA
jgi:hypothetical protein